MEKLSRLKKNSRSHYKPAKLKRPDRANINITGNNIYWYVVAKAEAGSKYSYVLLGPYPSEDKAYEVGTTKLNSAFKVMSSKHRDRSIATQEWRHNILDNTGDIGLSIRRMQHKV